MYTRVYVEITNICNMRCSFCHGHGRTHRQMTAAEFDHILDQLQGQTQYIYYHLMGEPLTHPQLPQFLEMAREKGFRSVITTNGTLLHKKGAQLLSAGVHKLNLSVHSFEQGDDTAFLQYMAQLADFALTASARGTLISMRLWNKGCDDGRNDRIVSYLKTRFTEPWTENSRGYRLQDKVYLEWGDRFQWPDRAAPDQGEQVFCYGLGDHFGILSDGSVVPCCLDSDGVITLGNIHTQSLTEILGSAQAQAMRHGFSCRKATEELCRRCGYARRFR